MMKRALTRMTSCSMRSITRALLSGRVAELCADIEAATQEGYAGRKGGRFA